MNNEHDVNDDLINWYVYWDGYNHYNSVVQMAPSENHNKNVLIEIIINELDRQSELEQAFAPYVGSRDANSVVVDGTIDVEKIAEAILKAWPIND